MDAWIVAVVTNSPKGGPPVATLFVAEGATKEAVCSAVLKEVVVPVLGYDCYLLPPEVSDAFNMRSGEVRRLA
jgi:hypothetical protein